MSNQTNESKITYRQIGDYQITNIILSPEEAKVELGVWGMKHKDYLMKNKQVLFNIMLTKGTLFQYLAELNKQAEEMFFRLVDDMAKAEGITAARLKGVKFGRPEVVVPDNFGDTVKLWKKGQITFDETLNRTQMKEATFYRRLREHRLLIKTSKKN